MSSTLVIDVTATASSAPFFSFYVERATVVEMPPLTLGSNVHLRWAPYPRRLSPQAYFWHPGWQAEELHADLERDAGLGVLFPNVEDAIEWLDRPR